MCKRCERSIVCLGCWAYQEAGHAGVLPIILWRPYMQMNATKLLLPPSSHRVKTAQKLLYAEPAARDTRQGVARLRELDALVQKALHTDTEPVVSCSRG